jgi:enoyl-CoA hydratase/carnithine racemase
MSDSRLTAAWVADGTNSDALLDPSVWRALLDLGCSRTPFAGFLPDGVVHLGPMAVLPALAARGRTFIAAGLPPSASGAGPAAALCPGTSLALANLPGGGMGRYLSMTGHAIGAETAAQIGLITHTLSAHGTCARVKDSISILSDSRRFDQLVDQLDFMCEPGDIAGDPSPETINLGERVAESFGAASSYSELLNCLEAQADASPWAEACLKSLAERPEWQSQLTFAQLDASTGLDLAESLALEADVAAALHTARGAGQCPSSLLSSEGQLASLPRSTAAQALLDVRTPPPPSAGRLPVFVQSSARTVCFDTARSLLLIL